MTTRFDAAAERVDEEADGAIFSEINITPFTDVILVLLIIFMVSSSAMVDAARHEERLEVALPQAGSSASAQQETAAWVVALTREGKLFADNRIVSDAELTQLLRDLFARAPKTQVIVDADGAIAHRKVVAILDRVRGAGFATVGIGTETP